MLLAGTVYFSDSYERKLGAEMEGMLLTWRCVNHCSFTWDFAFEYSDWTDEVHWVSIVFCKPKVVSTQINILARFSESSISLGGGQTQTYHAHISLTDPGSISWSPDMHHTLGNTV